MPRERPKEMNRSGIDAPYSTLRTKATIADTRSSSHALRQQHCGSTVEYHSCVGDEVYESTHLETTSQQGEAGVDHPQLRVTQCLHHVHSTTYM